MYMPPEVRRCKVAWSRAAYNPEKADIFSLGICLFMIMYQRPPFEVASLEDKLFEKMTTNFV